MSGHTNWKDLKHKGDPAKVAEHARAIDQALTLADLRKARALTQEQLARALDTNQSGVSRLEHQTDLFLSTLRSYVQALGGRLELTAIFDDAVVPIASLESLDEERELTPA